MCGISGFINASGKPVDQKILKAMSDKISHRGPDGEGFWKDGNIGLAHRRLAIIDLTDGANQPMQSQDGRYVIVFNGEIYNFKDIRNRMIEKGQSFTTNSDVEVLLEGFVRKGKDIFLELNGMFSIVIFDKKTKTLTLARDRFGVKPLYYIFQNGIFAFASEPKAFIEHPGLAMRLNATALAEYLTFMNFISDETLFKDVHLFPAGSFSQFNLMDMPTHKSELNINKFWDFRFTGDSENFNSDLIADEIHEKFTSAVRRQLVSDVGFSSFLSGGIDSGSIAALAAQEPGELQTFTACFDFSGTPNEALKMDERDAALIMSNAFKTKHHEEIIGHNDFERVAEKVCYYLDEPRVGQSYMNYLISGRVVREGEKVTLSGCGGDELFGGYPWRYYNGIPANNFDEYIDGYYAYWRRLTKNDNELKRLLKPINSEIKGFDAREVFKAIYPNEARSAKSVPELLNWSLYFESKTFMNGLLMVEDKVSMAHGLETRVPFLDNDLVNLACRVPIQAKLGNITGNAKDEFNGNFGLLSESQGRRTDGKVILRQMMKRLVPNQIVEREKQGFSAPDEYWFSDHSFNYLYDRLINQSRRLHDFIDKQEIQAVLEGHRDRTRKNGRLMIWAFFNLAETLDNFGL